MPAKPEDGTPFDSPDLEAGSDGLPIRPVGAWSKDKHHFLNRYIHAFTTSMKGKPAWSGLGYVDLFSGPGMCRLRETGEEIDGSPLLALGSSKPFDSLVFADISRDALHAIEERFKRRNAAIVPMTMPGDCNQNAPKIVSLLPRGHLHLAFLDPTSLDIHFSTIRQLTAERRVDLIVSFMDRIDLVRNIKKNYYPNSRSNLDMFLGEEVDWRREYDSLPNTDATHVSRLILELYQTQLREIGYTHFGDRKRIAGAVPYYLLFFASKHRLGADLWNRTSSTGPGGQRSFQW